MNVTAPLFEPITSGEARTWTPPQGRADIAPSRYERIERDGYLAIDAHWVVPALLPSAPIEGRDALWADPQHQALSKRTTPMTIPYHPLAELFPLMEGAAFDELVADIKAHGLHNPISLYETKILDGRNRERACEEAGVETFYDSYDGDDPLGFVVSQNVARRHLDDSQRAMIAARVENMPPHPGKDANLHTSRNEAARLLGINVRSVASASAILDMADPAVVKAVEQGRVTVSCASEIIKLNLDSEDTSELMTLPKADIPRNVERLKTEAKRKEAFERMTPQEWRRSRTPTRLTPTTTLSSLLWPNARRSCAT